MNIDFDHVLPRLPQLHKIVQERQEQRRLERRSRLLGLHERADAHLKRDREKLDEHLKTTVLQGYLNLFITGPVRNEFRMGTLPDNRDVERTRVLGLYEVVDPHPHYPVRIAALELAMSRLEYDLDLLDNPQYGTLIDALVDQRYPVAEVGDFGTLQQWLSREGSFWLEAQRDGQYVIDLTRYGQYDVRPHYRPYGCRAVVDADFNVVSVDGVGAGDAEFGAALSQLKSTLILDVILRCHAVLAHLLVSQKLYLAASTTYFDRIDADPVLRDLYYLCTYRTNELNSNIPILAGNQGSLVQLGFGLTSESFLDLLSDLITDPTLQAPSDIKRFLLDDRCPQWRRIADPVYGAVERFVDGAIGDKLPDDFKLQTKVALFVATFFHEMVGDFQLKTIFNCDLNARTYAGDRYDRRTDEFAYIIAAATIGVSVRILKLCDLVRGSYLSGPSLAAWTGLYDGLQAALKDHPWIKVDNFEFSVGY